ETGTGKTYGVMTTHSPSNVYHVTDYDHPFDSYNCQHVIAFDEFRSSIKLGEMLIYLDIYPCELPARYSNKYACYDTVYVISNWRLEDQYSDIQQKDQRSWNAFLRRISEVWIYTGYNKVTKYASVDAYLNRTETIEVLSSDIDIPFE
nr:hypothetical protein [Butyrivibrio sp.]